MSRIRTVKPELFRHEDLFDAELESGLPLRLAFIGLFTVADCEGRFRWKPRTLKLDVLPHDSLDFSQVLNALEAGGFIHRYTVAGETYGLIINFKKHQQIPSKEAERGSDLPQARTEHVPDLTQARTEHVPDLTQARTEHVPELREVEREGEGEREKEESIAPPAPHGPTPAPAPAPTATKPPVRSARPTPTRKTPCPPDLAITPELREWADQHGYHENLGPHLDHFRDKAIAKGYQYADWNAALRNAIRDDWAGLRKPPTPERPAAHGGGRSRPNQAPPPTPSPFRNPRADEFDAILRGGTPTRIIEGELADAVH